MRDQRNQEKANILRNVLPIFDPQNITEDLTVLQLDTQLDWHKQYDKTIAKSKYRGKMAKIEALRKIVGDFNSSGRRKEDVIAQSGSGDLSGISKEVIDENSDED